MKCILIDATKREVREVEIDNGIDAIYEQLGCRTFECIWIEKGNCIYVDEEGLLTRKLSSGWFKYEGYRQPIVGSGLIKCIDRETGEDLEPTLTVEEVRARVKFFHTAGRDN